MDDLNNLRKLNEIYMFVNYEYLNSARINYFYSDDKSLILQQNIAVSLLLKNDITFFDVGCRDIYFFFIDDQYWQRYKCQEFCKTYIGDFHWQTMWA